MATAIEIYDEREINPETLTVEPDAEALELIAELGLKRQMSEDGESRVAYPQPTADQGFVLAVIFAKATKLEDYDAGCIPLRVLKEIRSYKAENPAHTLFIRHATPAQVKDPVLLACTDAKHGSWLYSHTDRWNEMRLIARWGDALEPWDALLTKARRIMAGNAGAALDRIIRKATSLRDSIVAYGTYPSAQLPEISNLPEGW